MVDEQLLTTQTCYWNQDPKRTGHKGFGFVTFAEDGVADRVSRRPHEICGQQVVDEVFIPAVSWMFSLLMSRIVNIYAVTQHIKSGRPITSPVCTIVDNQFITNLWVN